MQCCGGTQEMEEIFSGKEGMRHASTAVQSTTKALGALSLSNDSQLSVTCEREVFCARGGWFSLSSERKSSTRNARYVHAKSKANMSKNVFRLKVFYGLMKASWPLMRPA